jgi:outer membrane protein TolC
VREAKHSANQRYEQVTEAEREANETVESAWETLAAATAEQKARVTQVVASEVARFGVKKEADYGARTVLDVLDADQELLEAKIALVIAQINERSARYSLATALGIFNPVHLGFANQVTDYETEVKTVRSTLFSTRVPSSKPQ